MSICPISGGHCCCQPQENLWCPEAKTSEDHCKVWRSLMAMKVPPEDWTLPAAPPPQDDLAGLIARLRNTGMPSPYDERDNGSPLLLDAAAALSALRAERDELLRDRQARNAIDPITRLHNLCDGLAESRRESPYDEESWRLADEENAALRADRDRLAAELALAKQDAARYEWLSKFATLNADYMKIATELLLCGIPLRRWRIDKDVVPTTIDAAIDAAMRDKRKLKGDR